MNDSVRVGVLEGQGRLEDVVDGLAEGEANTLVVQALGEGTAFHEIHDQVGNTVLLPDVVDANDSRVVESGRRACLLEEALPGGAEMESAHPNELDRHRPLEVGVVGAVDDAHAAASQLAEQVIASEGTGDGHLRQGRFGGGRAPWGRVEAWGNRLGHLSDSVFEVSREGKLGQLEQRVEVGAIAVVRLGFAPLVTHAQFSYSPRRLFSSVRASRIRRLTTLRFLPTIWPISSWVSSP